MAKVYAISPSEFALKNFKEELEAALKTGHISLFQLRMKDVSDSEFKENALQLFPICKKYSVPFIINDRVDIAFEIGADGIHIGSEDGAYENNKIADLRKKFVSKIIGASCYANKEFAIMAASAGVNYVSFGQFYETKTKPPKGKASVEILKWWQQTEFYPRVKSCAIGGLKPDNIAEIVKAGVDYIAVVTGIWEHPAGVAEAVKTYVAAIKVANQ